MPSSQAESGTDAGEIHGGSEEGFSHGAALWIVISPTFFMLKVDGAVNSAIVGELRGENPSGSDLFILSIQHFVKQREAITGANISSKIHIPGENIGQIHDLFIRQACFGRGVKQAAVDGALGKGDASFGSINDVLGFYAVFIQRDD